MSLSTEHIGFHHKESDGWITLAKKENGRWKQYHYRPDEVTSMLSEWLGEDVYFSQNTFYRPYRKIENIRQLRSLYVDVDCYLLNYNPEWTIGKLETEIFTEKVPEPNYIIFSGRGIICVWLIEPVPYKALPLWQAVQNHFFQQFEYVGADPKAKDAVRVFRLAGSVNSKNGETVTVQYRHEYRYELRQLSDDYLPELKGAEEKTKGRQKKIVHFFNVRKLHFARFRDLVRLVELRGFDIQGQREMICFLYRYWLCCFLDDPEEALHHTLDLNSQFKQPLTEREVIKATKSAEKAWAARSDIEADRIAKEKGYPGAGYNLKNETIIKWLDITEEEQQHMETIIGPTEKRRRNTLAKREKRRNEGVKPREEYLEEQQEKTEDKLWLLQKALEKNPKATGKELAEALNISRQHVHRLKKKLKV